MTNRRLLLLGILALCGWLTGQVAAPLFAQPKEDNAKPQTAADEERQLDIRYAQAYLRLVEATLDKYQETNRRQPNIIRRGVIQALQESVREAQDRIKLAESDDAHDAEIYVSGAEATLRAAEESLRKAQAANAQRPGTIGAQEIARLNAEIELGKVRIEKARHLSAESPLSNVRFEIEQLREQVRELRLIVALLRDRN